MIYQMQIYYGAVLDGKAVYSLESSLDDCKTFLTKIDESIFRKIIEEAIKSDGFKVEDFEIKFLTKEEYENRYDIENEKKLTWNINKK